MADWQDKVKELNAEYILGVEAQLDEAQADLASAREEILSLKHQNTSLGRERDDWHRKCDQLTVELRELAKAFEQIQAALRRRVAGDH